MIRFVITKRHENDYAYDLRTESNELLVRSFRFYSEDACRTAIEGFREHAQHDATYIRQATLRKNKFYFNLFSYYILLATSDDYDSEEARDNAIETIKRHVADAIVDPTVICRDSA